MPWPGTMFSRWTMSANVPWPWARSASTTCSLVAPAGRFLPMTPVKITSVALPRIRGPSTFITMPVIASRITPTKIIRSGAR